VYELKPPLLWVRFTPSVDTTHVVIIGPTDTHAWGREYYRRLQKTIRAMAATNSRVLARLYLTNRGEFRRYLQERAFLALPLTWPLGIGPR